MIQKKANKTCYNSGQLTVKGFLARISENKQKALFLLCYIKTEKKSEILKPGTLF